jgi:hypothetical protein
LQPAVAAGAADERRGATARRAGISRKIDRRSPIAREQLVPVAAQNISDPRQIVLLDQEVRASASTLAGAGRASDESRDVGCETSIAQRFHIRDRARARRNDRQTGEQLFGFVGGHRHSVPLLDRYVAKPTSTYTRHRVRVG